MDCTSYSEMHTDIQSGVWKDSWGVVWQSFSRCPHFSPGPSAAERDMVRPGCASRDVCPSWPAPSWQQGCPGDRTQWCLSPVLISDLERGGGGKEAFPWPEGLARLFMLLWSSEREAGSLEGGRGKLLTRSPLCLCQARVWLHFWHLCFPIWQWEWQNAADMIRPRK